jgi:hypothetical protein
VAPPAKDDTLTDGPPESAASSGDTTPRELSKKEQRAHEKRYKEELKRQEKLAKQHQRELEKEKKTQAKEAHKQAKRTPSTESARTPSTGRRTPRTPGSPSTPGASSAGGRTPVTGRRTPGTGGRRSSNRSSQKGSSSGVMVTRSTESPVYARTRKRMDKVQVSQTAVSIDENLDKEVAIQLILHDMVARQLFFEFLQREYSEENLLFWEGMCECRDATHSMCERERER